MPVQTRVKGKVAVKPAILYGLETKRQDMDVEEVKMLRLIRMDEIRNEYIRGPTQVG